MTSKWYQSWLEDWEQPHIKLLSLEHKGMLKVLEGLAVNGKPFGHITMPDGHALTIAAVATLTGTNVEQARESISELENRGAIGRSKRDCFTVPHLINRESRRRKYAKNGQSGAEVTNGKTKQKETLPQQLPHQTTRPKKEKGKGSKEKNTKKERPPPDPASYAFAGSVIRLDLKDYLSFRDRYSGDETAFLRWLSNRDVWLAEQPAEIQENWFISTTKYLEKIGVPA